MMQDSWQILRDNDKQLALCLLFAPKNDRRLLADIFCLANELENAVRIPSEIMLAAIRLQWWHDALADKETPPEVPLMQALQAHIAAMRISRDDLLALVALWQTRINDSEVSPTFCFAGCWQLAAKVTCGADFGDIAARIADQFVQNETGTHRFKAGDLGTLKRGGVAGALALSGWLSGKPASGCGKRRRGSAIDLAVAVLAVWDRRRLKARVLPYAAQSPAQPRNESSARAA
jgi:hypothetical protein